MLDGDMLKLKAEIKSDVISYLDKIKFEHIEITGQQLIEEYRQNKNYEEKETTEVSDSIAKLVAKIDEICTLALNDVDEYFNKSDSDSNDLLTAKKTKDEIKKDAIKHFLVYLDNSELYSLKYPKKFKYKFGLIIQIDFYPEKNDIDMIK